MRLFALEGSRELGTAVARRLGLELAEHEEREFEDGEHKTRPLVGVRGRDVFVLHSLYGEPGMSANDKLCRLLFFLGALRDADAARITAVVPYLCYARKDRKTKSRDPVTTRYVASLFEAVGTDRVVVLEVHNPAALQNAFRIRTEHLGSRPLFADHFGARLGDEEAVVVSPDVGGVKRAESFREMLERSLGRPVDSAFMEKRRSAGVVSGETLAGDVEGRVCILFDDLIATGTTMARASRACREGGATRVFCAAAHGLFNEGARELVAEESVDGIAVTDSVRPFRLDPEALASRVTVVPTAKFLAEAIRRLHEGGSIVDLLEDGSGPALRSEAPDR